MKLYTATDHGGFEYKEKIKAWLEEEGYDVKDFGAFEHDPDDDFTDFVIPLAKQVAKDWENGDETFGIILGRSGNGELIAANKVKGIRAILATSPALAKTAREHNNANIISLGADHISFDGTKAAIKMFINTDFLNKERYIRRIEATEKLENEN